MIAVVTGSTGFIGSHLVDALVARNVSVRALVRPNTPVARRDSRIAHWEADLLDDRAVRDSPIWEGATHVFHLAGITKGHSLAQFRRGNVFPTTNVLSALAGRGGAPPRVIVVSSQAAAGPASSRDEPIRESDRPGPVEAYGRSKLQAEQAVVRFRDTLPATIVRPASVYGPRDRDFLALFRQASGRVALHAAPRDNLFSIVHVRDVVRALLLCAEREKARGQTYFVANDAPISWRTMYEEVARIGGATPKQVQIPKHLVRAVALAGDVVSAISGRSTLVNRSKAALARPRWWLCDASALRNDLGWRAETPLLDGLRETYAWYVEAGWLRPPKTGQGGRTSERGVTS